MDVDEDVPLRDSSIKLTVYLDDLYPDPILPQHSHGARLANISCQGNKRGGADTQTRSNWKLEVDVSVVDVNTVFHKMMVLADPPDSCVSSCLLCCLDCSYFP